MKNITVYTQDTGNNNHHVILNMNVDDINKNVNAVNHLLLILKFGYTTNNLNLNTAIYGISSGEPIVIQSNNSVNLIGNSVHIQTTSTVKQKCRSHWVAVKRTSNWIVSNVVDSDNDVVDFRLKTIGGYRVYHATSHGAIENDYTFVLTKQ